MTGQGNRGRCEVSEELLMEDEIASGRHLPSSSPAGMSV